MNIEEIERVQGFINTMELKSKKDEYKFKRHYLMKYLRKNSTLSLDSIGNMFGKHHTTVINALKKVDDLEKYEDYQEAVNCVSVEFPMCGMSIEKNSYIKMLQQLENYINLAKN